MTPRIHVKNVTKNIIDVFFGEEGFENNEWTRFYVGHNHLKYLAGSSMPDQDFASLCKVIYKDK